MTSRFACLIAGAHLAFAVAFAPLIGVAQIADPYESELEARPSSALRPDTELVQGWQLMTPAERETYRENLQRATPTGRAALRTEHRWQMERRAQERGVDLGPAYLMEVNRPVRSQPERPFEPGDR